jgi:hypothetical protein
MTAKEQIYKEKLIEWFNELMAYFNDNPAPWPIKAMHDALSEDHHVLMERHLLLLENAGYLVDFTLAGESSTRLGIFIANVARHARIVRSQEEG